MRVTIYADVTVMDDNGKHESGYTTHIITLSNKEAARKLIEYFQDEGLDECSLEWNDFLVYDPDLD